MFASWLEPIEKSLNEGWCKQCHAIISLSNLGIYKPWTATCKVQSLSEIHQQLQQDLSPV